ncbi:5-oxoprolinase subunit C family protein [Williamsia deligens]|uniref:5-oxoprolinase subunit C family protein n=1 Tax=Williamsia deligens TaxID=321325 RepID=UPI0027E2718D|nr:biotin-dependent carboxyltransferase family protein [Williamsia deligens]
MVSAGPQTTVQDLGRTGWAHLGVPLAGAADRSSAATANRLVGNDPQAAVLEVTLGGFVAVAEGPVTIALAGARCDASVDGTAVGHASTVSVPDGATIALGTARSGLRCYLAVRGGIDAPEVLGSRSTDTLSGLGPPPVADGDRVAVGDLAGPWPSETTAFGDVGDGAGDVVLHAVAGPRDDAVVDLAALAAGEWVVDPRSDRIGVRLGRDPDTDDPAVRLLPGRDEVPSEGVALGSVQIPPSGEPVLFLADHPVTGGYPVVAVLTASSTDRAAQLVPGQRIRLRL